MAVVNKTQIDMRRKPEEWGSALYVQVGQIIDHLNQDVKTKLENYETRISKIENKVTKLQNEKI